MANKSTITKLVSAQGVDIVKNETQAPLFDKINKVSFTEKFNNLHLAQNFRFVWEKSKDYLELISQTAAHKKNAALKVAKEDLNFNEGHVLEPAPKDTLRNRLVDELKKTKLNTPKP